MLRRHGPLVLAGLLLLGGCGGAAHKAPTGTGSTPSRRDAEGCAIVARPKPRAAVRLAPPRGLLDPAKRYVANVQTNCGAFSILLDVKDSPKTVASFVSLAGRRFFDGLQFQRVASSFVIQGGDPQGSGFGGPGYRTLERPPVDVAYVRGTVAMARSPTDPSGAAGSQFFVVTAEDATSGGGLTPDFALLGRIISGMGVVDRIGSEPTRPVDDGVPVHPVVIVTLRIGS